MSFLSNAGTLIGGSIGGPVGAVAGNVVGHGADYLIGTHKNTANAAVANQLANATTPINTVDPNAFTSQYQYIDPNAANLQISPMTMAQNMGMSNMAARQAMNNQLRYQEAQLGAKAAMEAAYAKQAALKAALDANLATQMNTAANIGATFANTAGAGQNLLAGSFVPT